jgi:tRNA dimethylallyltransferase
VNKPKILVIVGPTASGKTFLSIELAKRFGGEIVSADSRQVYRGLNIGTGKVTLEEMQGVPHHLLDVADPKDTYTVADYVRDGRTAVAGILERGKLPIVVGGTFFYIDALLGRVSSPEVPPNEALREHLETLSAGELFSLLERKDPRRAESIDRNNPRRLVRALEIVEALGKVPEVEEAELYDVLTLGISIPNDNLKKSIHERLTQRIHAGMIDEVVSLEEDGLPFERLEELGIEYRHIAEYLRGKITDEEMLTEIETKSWQYAKRQMTWMKRDATIHWVNPKEVGEIDALVREFVG